MPRRNARSSEPCARSQSCALKADFAGIGLDQAEKHAGEGRLAAAGLADDAEGFAALERKADAIDSDVIGRLRCGDCERARGGRE